MHPQSDPLLKARALVLHDLQARELADAGVVSLLEDAVSVRRWWLEQWTDGAAFVAGLVAQDVQTPSSTRTAAGRAAPRVRWPPSTP